MVTGLLLACQSMGTVRNPSVDRRCLSPVSVGREEAQVKLDVLGIQNEYFEYEGMFHTFGLFDPYVSEMADRIDGFAQSLTMSETAKQ